jgi:Phage integrase protein
MPIPAPSGLHKISQWLRPKTASALKAAGLLTLGELVDLINRCGPGWWRSVPRIGARRAAAIERFLFRSPEQLGEVGVERCVRMRRLLRAGCVTVQSPQ